jgi:hypothetical protein
MSDGVDPAAGGEEAPHVPYVPEKTSRKERRKMGGKVIGAGTVVFVVALVVKLALTFHWFDDHHSDNGFHPIKPPTPPTSTFPRLVSPVAPAGPSLPAPSPAPSGGDPGWQNLALKCQHGSMRACDSLADQTRYANAPHYYQYGFTCGGRVVAPTASNSYVYCIDQFPKFP